MNTPEIKTEKTPVDMILEKVATMQTHDFLSWLTIHATDLKQREINLLAEAHFDGIACIMEAFSSAVENPLNSTNEYMVKKYKHLPTTEEA